MLVLAMHCAVLLEGLRTTATHIVFLHFAATIVSSSFLTLTKLSQSRSSFPVQELSVSLGEVIPLVFLPRAAVFDFYKFIRPLFVLLPQQSQHFSALHGDSVASSPECVFSLRWFTPRPFFFNEVDLPLSRELPRIIDHRRLPLRRNMHPAAQREPESVFSHLEERST